MFADAQNLVFKVGTSTLAHGTGKLNLQVMEDMVGVLSDLANAGKCVTLVSSGAIGVGAGKLGLAERPADTAGKQAAATVGQCELMFMYDKMFSQYGHKVGQLLITREDIDNPERRFNLTQTFNRLFEYGVIPVINENDAVAVEEIVYGDNDSLSAMVAKLIGADALVILTETDGLYTADPSVDPNAERIPYVLEITDAIRELAGQTKSRLGTGGMATKLHAAEIAVEAGIDTYIINGKKPREIYELARGGSVGTQFRAMRRRSAEQAAGEETVQK